ncbi:MAG: hypothetical protein ABEJ72_10010 [Candidatus Aenigmatarchaeota archaeon]
MGEIESEFSRRELKSFLEELGEQVEMGRVEIHVPGRPDGNVSVLPEQPIDVLFERKNSKFEITIKFVDRKESD